MLKEFREFVLRGNVVDLAVAVVIGAAFTAIINSIVIHVLNPLIGAVFNAEDLAKAGEVRLGSASLSFGAVAAALLQFLIVAAVVFFLLVLPVNALRSRNRGASRDKPEAFDLQVELLAEIRDLLAAPPVSTARHAHVDTAGEDSPPSAASGEHGQKPSP
ncbi:large conductance mechanosensitive channel protein MscL [Leifsonia sp. NPDC056665]|uniref:large conductance mechanosensitive channel protein MscL n=1 Tax=Leifsonia sp. NPDC056665 TaxID=3345901 RepID=UPI0036999596